jgi:hypothetical protein
LKKEFEVKEIVLLPDAKTIFNEFIKEVVM